MKDFKDMTTEELEEYHRRVRRYCEDTDMITGLVTEFLDLYTIRSKENNKMFIIAFEKYVDLYEKESIELNFDTEFAEIQRDFIPLMKSLAKLD